MKGDRRFRSIIGSPLASWLRILLGFIGLGIILAAYSMYRAHVEASPDGNVKFFPSGVELVDAFRDLTSVNKRTGTVVFWSDIWASLWVLLKALFYSAGIAWVVGVLMGVFSSVRAMFAPILAAISKVPPIALLGMFFIIFGVAGDRLRSGLIFFGIMPTLATGIMVIGETIPKNLIVKAYSLGASTPEVVVKVAVPLMLPQTIQLIRLSIGPAWVYLIAAEYIAASEGIGYRIALSTRSTEPAKILVYCIALGIIGTLMDYILVLLSRWISPWAAARKDD